MVAMRLLPIRDSGPYSTRNTSKGALLAEAAVAVTAVQSGLTARQARAAALDGRLFLRRTRETRQRVWDLLLYRLLTPERAWVGQALADAVALGARSPEFVSLVYCLYAVRDRLAFDVVTRVLWARWGAAVRVVSRDDVLALLDQAAEAQPVVRTWTTRTRSGLAGGVLTALRDFGLLQGTQKKVVVRPVLPLTTAAFLLHLLTEEGVRGSAVLDDATWRLFLLTTDDVAHVLAQLAQARVIRFERVGRNVVLDTPDDWRCDHECA
jgi:hypothetical protein